MSDNWKLDRRVPLAVVIALVSQIVVVILWGAKTDARITSVENVQADTKNVSQRLTTVEVQTAQTASDLHDVKASLQRIEDRLYDIRTNTKEPAQ